MLFTLKKIVSLFLMPISIGLIGFFIGLFYLFNEKYKKAKLFLTLSFLWLVLIGYSPFSNFLIQPLEKQYKSYLDINKNIKYVLILGSGHVSNEQMPENSQLSKTALARLNEGIRIFKQLDDAKLILSGYEVSDEVPHASVLKSVAISLGVSEESILTQEKAKDTQEEALYVKQIVGDDKFILVTSASHMPRAIKIFKSESLKPIAAPTDFLSKEDGDYGRVPSAKEILKTEKAMHEHIGSLWHDIIETIRYYVN